MTPQYAYVLRSPPLGLQRRVLGTSTEDAASPEAGSLPHSGASTLVPGPPDLDPAAVEAGHAAGFERGWAEAAARAQAELEARLRSESVRLAELEQRFADECRRRLDALDVALGAVDGAVARRLEQLAQEAIALAYEAVCRVVGPDAGRGRVVADVVQHGIEGIRSRALLSIRLHPRDFEALDGPEGRRSMASHPAVRWAADPSLEPTQWMLDTESGSLDVGLATQLARLRDLWAGSHVDRHPDTAPDGAAVA